MMTEIINIGDEIKNQMPSELVGFMQVAGTEAQRRGERLYLVGGVVRDLILRRANLDLDLVVEGDAIALAQQLSEIIKGTIIVHSRFGTAKLQWDDWSVDIATARSETYACPGALPVVKSGSIRDDLFRRDFTINAMAVELGPERYGEILDLYGGRDDLQNKLVRVLHEKSFVDDATRIWRGLRYEQRLGFHLESATLKLLNRDISWLDAISGDRIRHELDLALHEAYPEKVLRRAGELSVLARLHPSMRSNGWPIDRFERVRRLGFSGLSSVALYLALLAYPLNGEEIEQLILYLRLSRSLSRTLRDSAAVKDEIELLAEPGLAHGSLYSLLRGYSRIALLANSLAADLPVARQHIDLYLNKLRHVKPTLTGVDLQKMGIAPGPRIKETLERLREARLEGRVHSRKGEEEMVSLWLAHI